MIRRAVRTRPTDADRYVQGSWYWEFDPELRQSRYLDKEGIPVSGHNWHTFRRDFNFDHWLDGNKFWKEEIDPELALDEGI